MKNDWKYLVDDEVSKTAETICRFDEDLAYIDEALATQKESYSECLKLMQTELKKVRDAYADGNLDYNALWTGSYADKPEQKDELISAFRFGSMCTATHKRISDNYQKYILSSFPVLQHELERVNGRRLCDEQFRIELKRRLDKHAGALSFSFPLMILTGFIFYPFVEGARKNKLLKQMLTYAGIDEIEQHSQSKKMKNYENCNFDGCCESIAKSVKQEKNLFEKGQLWQSNNTKYGEKLKSFFEEISTVTNLYLKPFREELRNEEIMNNVVSLLENGKAETLSDIYKIMEVK